MAHKTARGMLRKYFYRSMEPRICNVKHLLKHLKRKGFKIVRRK